MEMQIRYLSHCCGAYLDDAQVYDKISTRPNDVPKPLGICNDCGEHCEIVTEEYPCFSFAQQRRADRLRNWSKQNDK